MNAVRTINIDLEDDIATELDDAIARGEFFSAQDAVRDLLLTWSSERAGRETKLARLRSSIQEGFDSGEPIDGNFDLGDIKSRNAARLSELRSR